MTRPMPDTTTTTTPTPPTVTDAEVAWREWESKDADRFRSIFGVETGPIPDAFKNIFKAGYLAAIAAARAEGAEDTARLEWMFHHGAQVRFDCEDGRAYLVMPYHTGISCADDHHRFDTPRAAIDQMRKEGAGG